MLWDNSICLMFVLFLSVQEVMNFSAITVTERTTPGQRQSVEAESKTSDNKVRYITVIIR